MTTSVTAGTGTAVPEVADPARGGRERSRALGDADGHPLVPPDPAGELTRE